MTERGGTLRLAWSLGALGALVACDGPELEGEDFVDCTGAEPFSAGMAHTSEEGLTVSLVEASPAPPDRGENDWVLEVTTEGGAPAEDLPLLVYPFMPLHGHGLAPALYAATEEAPGRYAVDTFRLIMPGLWEFTVWLEPLPEDPEASTEEVDRAVFALCAEG